MITETLLSLLSKTLSKALTYDPATRARLSNIDETTLRLIVTEPITLSIDISFANNAVKLARATTEPVDITIKGNALALLQLLVDNDSNIQKSNVTIEGNIRLLAKIQDAFKDLDIDWEEPLTQALGDIAGHNTANFIRAQIDRGRTITKSTPDFIRDTLIEELKCSPSESALQSFYDEVDNLTSNSQRLASKILKIQNKIGN